MKFAFSTLTCPGWDVPTLVARSCEYGYDGVEFVASDQGSLQTDSDLSTGDLKAIRAAFESAGVEIACLSGPVLWTGRSRQDRNQSDRAGSLILRASELNCRRVKIFNTQLRRGQSGLSAGAALGKWLLPLADEALSRGITLVVENAPGLRSATEMWSMLDRLRHPALACCWDPLNAALVGETPALSVPTLNSRIQYARVKDAKLGPSGPSYCKLGEGDVDVEKFISRLRGIGYGGYVTAAWERARLPEPAEPEELLPEALAKLKIWATGGLTSPVSKSAPKQVTGKQISGAREVSEVPVIK